MFKKYISSIRRYSSAPREKETLRIGGRKEVHQRMRIWTRVGGVEERNAWREAGGRWKLGNFGVPLPANTKQCQDALVQAVPR